MAKKKSSNSSNSANALAKEMQQIAANAQIQVQQLANQATEKSFQYNSQEAATARAFNEKEAKVSRDWQEYMSNTAHKREVADLRNAGLNPVLSANSGAQSYTTSSASAQNASASAVDASGTVGSLAGNLIQSRTGAYQADVSAKATRAAAAQTAAATKYAAAQAASAQRYAAAMAYQNNRMHEQWQTGYLKDVTKSKIEIIKHTPVKSVGGVLDKLAENAGLYGVLKTNAVKDTVKGMTKFLNSDPKKYFKNSNDITKNNFKLNSAGKSFINNMLKIYNMPQTKVMRNLFVRAVVFRDPFAFTAFRGFRARYTNNVNTLR